MEGIPQLNGELMSPPPPPASSADVVQLPRVRGSAGMDRGAASESRIGVTNSTQTNVNTIGNVMIDSAIETSSCYSK